MFAIYDDGLNPERGQINVEVIMDYVARQERVLKLWYLKAFWTAKKEDRPKVLALYGRLLREALEEYRGSREWNSDSAVTNGNTWRASVYMTNGDRPRFSRAPLPA